MDAREVLVDELRRHALVIGDVVLTSGRRASYYVDAKRAILLPVGFRALGELLAERAQEWDASAVGGLTMGADAVACAALGAGVQCKAFFVRKEVKQHGLSRRIEGPLLRADDRCMVVEDVVSTGGSTLTAIEALREAGHEICGVISVLDRELGGAEAIAAAVAPAPYVTLCAVSEIYPGNAA